MRLGRREARRSRLLAALCVTMMVATACRQLGNVETISYGREFAENGTRLRVAALQPRCGCLSLANISKLKERVWIESWFYGVPRGSMILDPEGDMSRARIRFDWAGPERSDFYELVAFKVTGEKGSEMRDAGLRIQDVVGEYAPLVFVGCNDETCDFGSLAMNRAFLGGLGQGGQELGQSVERGVNVSSVIEVAAPPSRCGCMMVRNFSQNGITLRAMLHGAETGQLTLNSGAAVPIPFDWAGLLDSDFYVIDAVAVGGAPSAVTTVPAAPAGRGRQGGAPGQPNMRGGQAGVPGPPAVMPPGRGTTADVSTMSIRLRDYITVVGELVDMECTPERAVFIPLPGQATPPGAGGAAQAPAPGTVLPGGTPTNLIQCPWIADDRPLLGMYAAYVARGNKIQAPAKPATDNAQQPGSTQEPAGAAPVP